jgi:hypothetical protein
VSKTFPCKFPTIVRNLVGVKCIKNKQGHTFLYTYRHVIERLWKGFGLVIGFTELFDIHDSSTLNRPLSLSLSHTHTHTHRLVAPVTLFLTVEIPWQTTCCASSNCPAKSSIVKVTLRQTISRPGLGSRRQSGTRDQFLLLLEIFF